MRFPKPILVKTKNLLIPLMVMGHVMPALAQKQSHPDTFVLGNESFRVDITVCPKQLLTAFGPRFDNTAMVNQVRLNGNPFLAPNGLTDEFGIDGTGVLGFGSARAGEDFLKIGVGKLVRTSNPEYQFWNNYAVSELLPVHVQHRSNVLTVHQQGSLTRGYGYSYTKCYRVFPESSTLVIEYQLKNSGRLPLIFNQYNHNWFAFSGRGTAPPYFVETAFPVSIPDDASWIEVTGSSPRLRMNITNPVSNGVHFESKRLVPPGSNRFIVGHPETGQIVEVSGDFPIARFDLFADKSALCPEVFLSDIVRSGQLLEWRRTYRFLIRNRAIQRPSSNLRNSGTEAGAIPHPQF